MAGKPKRMSQVKQLLRLYQQGEGKKKIARTLNISKNTVKSYLDKLGHLKESIEELIKLDDIALEAKFHAGNPAYKDNRYEHLKANLDYYVNELPRDGVTRQLLWEEYIDKNPQGYSRSQFCYHLQQYLHAAKPSMVLTHKPGEKLYIDFAGKKLSYTNAATGEIISCQVFVACLPYSGYSFAMAVKSQNIEDFIHALRCCLEDIGGVPLMLVPDNLKSAIVKANNYEPTVNQSLEDFANHYDTIVVPTRPAKPKDKALVENQVRLVYQRVYAKLRDRVFFSLTELNQSIKECMRRHNQTRMQKKPYCRQERFLADEKHLLKPLPTAPYDIKYYRQLKVAQNNHIYLGCDKHYYSVPFAYIGQKVKVVYTRSLVLIYAKNKQVAAHARNFTPGGYTTDKAHLCSTHQHYLNRSPDYYIQKAKSRDHSLYELFKRIFDQDRHPEQLYRSCDGLLSLQRKTPADEFRKACQIAIENQVYSYIFISRVIKNKMTGDQKDTPTNKALPKHKNIRGKAYYLQTSLKFNTNVKN